MQHNITFLRTLALHLREGHHPTEIAASMEHLADRMEREAATATPSPPAPTDSTEEDIAALYNGHAAILRRLTALHDAMHEAAKREALHPSVRFLADTIALNLSAPTTAPAPTTDLAPDDCLIYLTVCSDPLAKSKAGFRVYAIPYSQISKYEQSTEAIASDRGVSDD